MRSGGRLASGAAGIAALAMLAVGCSSSTNSSSKGGFATASSAAAGGGMAALVTAAQKEGQLNVITLPPDWANYGEIISTFSKKYGIKVNSANPNGSSADEITAVKQLKGQSRAPDVLDVGNSFALQGVSEGLLAPYQVSEWNSIPAAQKDASGKWFSDYGGYVSIAYDAKTVKTAPTSFADLKKPEYKNKIALNGDPTQTGASFAAVYAAALANGGSFDNILPGIQYFADLKKAGNFLTLKGTPATVESGQTPILIWWDYLNASAKTQLSGKVDWTINIPSDGIYANYYDQAISATAPHPAAARLWEEYLYSDAGQNLFLKGKARPVLLPTMTTAGTVDKTALAALPAAPAGTTTFPTQAQITKAEAVVNANWAKMVGGA
ncbi:MAG: ABC transporter substrate-binding protein [Frankia sp.]